MLRLHRPDPQTSTVVRSAVDFAHRDVWARPFHPEIGSRRLWEALELGHGDSAEKETSGERFQDATVMCILPADLTLFPMGIE